MPSTKAIDRPTKVPCICCGTESVSPRGFCSRCLVPLELSRSVHSRGKPARFLSVLGASGSGKTVFLGLLLDILSKGSHGLEGLPNGSFSVAMQQETICALQNQRFPEKTPSEADNWKWVHCEVSNRQKRKGYVDLITPDLAGEAIALEVEVPGTFSTIKHVVLKSEAHILLIDSQRARDNGRDEDFFGLKLLSYMHGLHSEAGRNRRGRLTVPMAILFTKADTCPESMENTRDFAAANLPGLYRFCERNISHQFFAASVVGNSATLIDDCGNRLRIPLHVEPTGIIEPLKWLIDKLPG